MAQSGSASKTAVWVLMGLLILGLAGFGATNLSGNLRTIGDVGDKPVTVQRYVRALQQEIRGIEAQTGQPLPMAQAREIGLDEAVLNRLITERAIDHETTQLGLSVGDETVRDQVLAIPAFRGVDGKFSRDDYRFMLENAGLSEGEFETQIREETARNLVQNAVVSGIAMPDSYGKAMLDYIGERRDLTLMRVTPDALAEQPAEPTEDELKTYHSDNAEAFTLPETKNITYALLTPDMLVDQVELEEDALRAAYDERVDEYNQPERRLVERLVYPDQEAAEQAAASLEVGSAFEVLVIQRGLELGDTDLGDVTRRELGEAGDAVFTAQPGEVVGPLPSGLGPALYRVNGVLPAQVTTYEDALPELRETLALDKARRLIEAQAENIDDLLAGGATLEELADETDMALGQIDWTEESGEDIAAYEDFRVAAAAVTAKDFPAVALLDDGGLYAMRLNEALPERPAPFDVARADVVTALTAERLQSALEAHAGGLLDSFRDGTMEDDRTLQPYTETGRTRGDFIPDVPADFMTRVFDMTKGEAKVISGGGQVILTRLDAINPPEETEAATQTRARLQDQAGQSLSRDLFSIYANDVILRAGPQIDRRAIDAIHANFQ